MSVGAAAAGCGATRAPDAAPRASMAARTKAFIVISRGKT
jgi:hypothetical protein